MKRPLPVPSETAAFTGDGGQATTHARRYFESLGASVGDLITDVTGKASVSQTWEQSFLVEYPEAQDYKVVVKAALARTITSVTTICATGTATLTVKINTTALGGTANSVSTSEQSQAHTTANAVAAGDDIVFTFSSVSSAERVSVTLSGMRTLA